MARNSSRMMMGIAALAALGLPELVASAGCTPQTCAPDEAADLIQRYETARKELDDAARSLPAEMDAKQREEYLAAIESLVEATRALRECLPREIGR